jgi:hypothetical protein
MLVTRYSRNGLRSSMVDIYTRRYLETKYWWPHFKFSLKAEIGFVFSRCSLFDIPRYRTSSQRPVSVKCKMGQIVPAATLYSMYNPWLDIFDGLWFFIVFTSTILKIHESIHIAISSRHV